MPHPRFYSLLLRRAGKLRLVTLQRIGTLLGQLLWLVRSRMWLVTQRNIALCFPELDVTAQNRLARRSLLEAGRTLVESAFVWTAPVQRCRDSIVGVEGREHVDRAIAEGKGLIFVIPHLGNWEMINHYLGPAFALTHMYQPHRTPKINAMVQSFRERTGTKFVEASGQGIREQLSTLRAGGCIGTMPDQEPDVHAGTFAPFFGTRCLTTTLIGKLAHRTGAATVIASCERLEDGAGFRIHFDALDLAETEVARLNAGIERAVRRVPEQYLWSYKRFRTRPPGEAETYQFRQHPVRVFIESWWLRGAMALAAVLPLTLLRSIGSGLGETAAYIGGRATRITRTNITLCQPAPSKFTERELIAGSLAESGKTLIETPRVWYSSRPAFQSMLTQVEGLEYLPAIGEKSPLIMLTPPLGHREVAMRYLGERYAPVEYYYPNSNTARDDLIRRQRTRLGIRLVPHSDEGVGVLIAQLESGGMVTICPDQQPRLRTGEFAPFFGIDALTTPVIGKIAARTGAAVLLTAAIRTDGGFQLHFEPCPVAGYVSCSALNAQLEAIVRAHPMQYRWSDKRFNIRPKGETKLYRRVEN